MSLQTQNDIGTTAGRVWCHLHEHGATTASRLSKVLGVPSRQVDRAVGWLAREHKLEFVTDRRAVKISLAEG
jgi:hypothetical protein